MLFTNDGYNCFCMVISAPGVNLLLAAPMTVIHMKYNPDSGGRFDRNKQCWHYLWLCIYVHSAGKQSSSKGTVGEDNQASAHGKFTTSPR